MTIQPSEYADLFGFLVLIFKYSGLAGMITGIYLLRRRQTGPKRCFSLSSCLVVAGVAYLGMIAYEVPGVIRVLYDNVADIPISSSLLDFVLAIIYWMITVLVFRLAKEDLK